MFRSRGWRREERMRRKMVRNVALNRPADCVWFYYANWANHGGGGEQDRDEPEVQGEGRSKPCEAADPRQI